MGTVHTAVGECLRTGIDALRGLGFSFSVADRLARALTWPEATGLNSFRYVRLNEDRIRAAMKLPFALSTPIAGQVEVNVLDAAGKSLFEAGPRALDLANADARIHGVGLAVVRQTFGALLLGELAQTSVERGLGVFIFVSGGADENQDPCGALLGLEGGVTEIVADERDAAQLATDFVPLLIRLAGQAAVEMVLALLTEGPKDAALSNIAVLSFPLAQSAEIAAIFKKCSAEAGLNTAERQVAAWHKALHDGFEVEQADWTYLYSLVARTRVETSEHSRSHAG